MCNRLVHIMFAMCKEKMQNVHHCANTGNDIVHKNGVGYIEIAREKSKPDNLEQA